MGGTHEGGKKASMGGRGDSQKASPAAVERYLKGMHYPAGKNELLAQAQSNKAPQDVINVLNRFGEKEYSSPIDVNREVGKVE